MKITAFETIRLDEFPNLVWLQIHTDEGLVGLGETFFGPEAAAAFIHESAAPRLLGKDPLQIDRHSKTLTHDYYLGFTGSGAEMRGASAIDIALWDIFGQATGRPIHQLLGGPVAREGAHLQHLRRLPVCPRHQGPDDPELGPGRRSRGPTRISTPSSTGPTSWRIPCWSRASPA